MFNYKKNINKIFAVAFIILALSFSRLIPHPWNFSPMIAAGIFAGFYFRQFYLGSFIIILSMFLGDLFLGFHNTMFFTYLALAIVVLIGIVIKNLKFSKILLFFFINFSTNKKRKEVGRRPLSMSEVEIDHVNALKAYDMYTKDFNGLMQSYIMAIPFFHNSLISTFIYLFVFKTLLELALKKKIIKVSS